MTQLLSVTIVLALGVSGFSASAETAPSRLRRFCEEALIYSGLYQPQIRARIMPVPYKVELPQRYVVHVHTPGLACPRAFTYTNRDAFELRYQLIYPPQFLDPKELQGKTIVDLACGEGRLVEDFRRHGVDARGLDIHLNAYAKTKDYFVQASMDDLPFPDQSVDVLMSSMGPIRYFPKDAEFMQRILREAHRVLKPGGVVRISPLELEDLVENVPHGDYGYVHLRLMAEFAMTGARPEVDLANTGLWPLPAGLRVKSAPGPEWFQQENRSSETGGPYYWIELERYD